MANFRRTELEHYKEAERLIGDARENSGHQGAGDPCTADFLAEAQVHATLDEDVTWHKAAGEDPSKHEGGAA